MPGDCGHRDLKVVCFYSSVELYVLHILYGQGDLDMLSCMIMRQDWQHLSQGLVMSAIDFAPALLAASIASNPKAPVPRMTTSCISVIQTFIPPYVLSNPEDAMRCSRLSTAVLRPALS